MPHVILTSHTITTIVLSVDVYHALISVHYNVIVHMRICSFDGPPCTRYSNVIHHSIIRMVGQDYVYITSSPIQCFVWLDKIMYT